MKNWYDFRFNAQGCKNNYICSRNDMNDVKTLMHTFIFGNLEIIKITKIMLIIYVKKN